jgi:CheY-like chemotaxis protein
MALCSINTVLLVEDSDDDVFLFNQAVLRGSHQPQVLRVHDGAEGMAYLNSEAPYEDRKTYPEPDLIITDLKMPRCTGFEFLTWVKRQPTHSALPVVVMSSSFAPGDVNEAYKLGANAFVSKPSGFNELISTIQTIFEFWQISQQP